MKYLLFTLFVGITLTSFAQTSSAFRAKNYNLEKTVAIEGHDPVAYFTKGKAVEGTSRYKLTHLGVTYYFSTEANKKTFQGNPGKYEPKYGGWCAYAMGSSGEKVSVDPETFKIIDGKLYLFYNAYFNNTLNSWNKDEKNLKAKANANWKKITGK